MGEPGPSDAGTTASTGTIAGTIVARNYVPAARVLAGSYRHHHPGAEFAVLVIDAEDDELAALTAEVPGTRFLGPNDIDLDPSEFGRMALAYTVTEFCTAVKPWLLRTLLADHPVAIYLDPDIEVFAPFAGTVGEAALEHAIVLTPHVLEPMPRDGLRPSEADIMASGVFNLGFIGVSRDAAPFLTFWADRLRQDAISSVTEQLFTDQRWVDNVPALFGHTVITDPGYNLAYWNVYQRPLATGADGTVTAAGRPVRFVHFSGYRPEKPWLVSTHYADRPRVLLSEHPLLAELIASYRTKLTDAGYRQALDDVRYRWSTLPDGTPVPPALRRAYRQAWVDSERVNTPAPPNPFRGDTAEDLLRWAIAPGTPQQERAGLSRWATALWQSRTDLQQVYPDPLHADAEGYRHWCLTSGVNERELPPDAVAVRPDAEPVPVVETLGANVLGYLTAELGVGEMGRLVHDAVVASGVPVATAVEEFTVASRTSHPLPADAALGDPRFGVSVLVVNADMTAATLRLHPDLGRDRYVIGVWSWELSTFPPAMHPAFGQVDEIWTISDFCAAAIAAHSPVPVHRIPVPVRDPLAGQDTQRHTPGADGITRFLFVFDHNSIFDRKNPLAAIEAFRTAFPDRADVRLVLKTINGDKHPGDSERLRMAVARDERIELIDQYLAADEVAKLFTAADGYLSLHRSEGFGLTVAEAMAHGLPVVATDYGGTSEFLTRETGWPIPYRMVDVGPGNEPYPRAARWAEPDVAAAAAALREIADHPAQAVRRGAAARQHVLSTRSPRIAADWAHTRLEAAHAEWLHRRTDRTRPGPLAPIERSREALRWRADPAATSKVPMAATLRRGILRVLDHYDHHQRAVLGELMNGVAESVTQLAAGQQQLAERIDRLEHGLAGGQNAQHQVNADVARQLRELPEEMDRRIGAQANGLGQRIAEFEHETTRMFHERAEWMAAVEAATTELTAEVPLLRTGLLHHHDLLSPDPAGSQAVVTDVGPLRLPADDTVVLPWLRRYGTWEADESRLVDLLLPRGGTFVDIGAHVGYFTVRALHRVGAGGTVVAAEPWRRVRDLLALNVAANVPAEVAAALTVVPSAAWHTDGPLRLALADDGNSGDNRVDPAGPVEITGIRLDGLPELAGRKVDVVKCDAQGRDHLALSGLTGLFEVHRPHLLVEFWPAVTADAGDDPSVVLDTYRSWGYRPTPVDAALVDALTAAGGPVAARTFDAGPELSNRELIEAAMKTAEGFLTLWLRPA
ncbi:MAG: FkbM family methyltransferase [Actinophytocola sp.]|uniref:FkbM family methyltransferase n=1 Tax=Actinophytocola sp. TaxID=1872138 RepID=UPI001326B1E0|nr:FkbM family methyltransferase [Actinophytocola sp.]MPZ81361.1 FkbM family methyltransferase [Actinophytocola sp.]